MVLDGVRRAEPLERTGDCAIRAGIPSGLRILRGDRVLNGTCDDVGALPTRLPYRQIAIVCPPVCPPNSVG
jgi:hypothetical protein